MSSSNEFNPKTFVSDVRDRLAHATGDLEWLVRAYGWARRNIKRVHRHWKGYRQEWLHEEILRAFNVNPREYIRLVTRYGGGQTLEHTQRGFAILRQFGIYECSRADRLLTAESVATLGGSLRPETTLKEFRAKVDDLAAELSSIKPTGTVETAHTNYKALYAEARKEIRRLKHRVHSLEKQLRQYETLKAAVAQLQTQ